MMQLKMLFVAALCFLCNLRTVESVKLMGFNFWPWSSSGSSQASGMIQAPIDGAWQDEALPPTAAPSPKMPVQQSPHQPLRRQRVTGLVQTKKSHSHNTNYEEASSIHSTKPGADFEWANGKKSGQPKVSLADVGKKTQEKVSEEYDEIPESQVQKVKDITAALFKKEADSAEPLTMEERARATSGDVEHLSPEEIKKIPVVTHHRHHPPAALMSKKQDGTTHKKKNAGRPLPKEQCMEFALWAKSLNIHGNEVMKLFKSTCAPGAASGQATAKFTTMCDGLDAAFADVVKEKNWIPAKACYVLLKHFEASQVGSSPVVDD
eukprot:TRINITY_DN83810_c0_g1_i1.p1 TRINITY_DN83810_c0_g1~~TRINITY_DN83810_c0_g1_i1.p1  ORF type:complete len:321 (+),score=88.23 TRINITY_DN83810_c0_g1_i1:143-1105(+)